MESKTLVVYYSQSGQTKRMAEMIAKKTGADIYEIVPAREYNSDMWKAWDEAREERSKNRYPELKGKMPDISKYDTILIGGASWGYTLPNPVTSFVRQMDFTNKKVSGFWTFFDHDEKWNNDLKAETAGAEYVNGLPLPRSVTASRDKTNEAMDKWIATL